ncbi:uncharacterized protein JNUCC1_03514 [Lentibacillus sp. JNUCC-1]|uniref:endolytic transglycosylase MltG n=1 Tax=Lentibacillus sp. JNUCC-1 TaxID=2654513 RepID=UPI00132AD096|nr:endolytic transglycosylase MltG [Lentibacillus sp. JNUCC-1]MUV39630.1 uncharacterized protein [Lentibacillus sp. JNUCC-1]
MKQPIRIFSIGLITAGLIMLVVYMFNDSEAVQEELTTDEMIAHLKKENMRVIPEDEYIALSVDKSSQTKEADTDTSGKTEDEETNSDDQDQSSETESDDTEQNKDKEDAEKEERASSKSFSFTIEPGMSSRDISTTLENKGIIDDAEAFNAYLQENDYSMLIQIGTFEVKSSMSAYELAETLTNP